MDQGTRHNKGRHFMTAAFRSAKSQFDQIARRKLKEQIELAMHRKK